MQKAPDEAEGRVKCEKSMVRMNQAGPEHDVHNHASLCKNPSWVLGPGIWRVDLI